MRFARSLPMMALLLLAVSRAAATEAANGDLRRDVELAREQVFPALVNITVVVEDHQGGRTVRIGGAGSGVIVSPAGHVLTNFHVAGGARRIVCRLPSDEEIAADVVVHDPLTDLSVLKLRLGERGDRNRPLPFARIGDSDALRTGDHVLAMGNPLTLSSSMTLGIVSNPRRVLLDPAGTEIPELDLGEGELTGLFTRWIQHDALIAPGNSGGPLVNLRGEVVGINELGGSGIGFAIPSNLAREVLNQALAGGEVVRAWAGMSLYPSAHSGDARGVIVEDIEPGGPAEAAGLSSGDRILEMDGEPANAATFEGIPPLYRRIANREPGSRLRLRFERAGEVRSADLLLVRMEPLLPRESELRGLGVTVRDLSGAMVRRRHLPVREGVLVSGVRPGRAAHQARPPILADDIVVAVDGRPVRDVASLRKELEPVPVAEHVVLTVRRGGEEILSVVGTAAVADPVAPADLPRPCIGVRTQVLPRDPGAEAGDLVLRVTEVTAGSGAEAAGIRVGDVITALDGEPLRPTSMRDGELLVRRIGRGAIGDRVRLALERGEERLEAETVLEETPETADRTESAADDFLEFAIREVSREDRRKQGLPAVGGVLVTHVETGGWAGLGGLRAGDVLLRIDEREIGSAADLRAAAERVRSERPRHILLVVRREYRTAVVFVEPCYE